MEGLLIGSICLQLLVLLLKPVVQRFVSYRRKDQDPEDQTSGTAMDGYPRNYVSHNVPLIVLSGLGTGSASNGSEARYPLFQEKGVRLSSDSPSVSRPEAEELAECFKDFDARDAAWNHRPSKGKMGSMSFTYRHVGRTFLLPPRKAKVPTRVPSPEPVSEDYQTPRRSSGPLVLHSPLSPLTPDSPIFPDGILTPFWFTKHQRLLPSAVICFFWLTVDSDSSTLEDNRLKNEINVIRSSLSSSGYKSRLVVVLISEDDGPVEFMEQRIQMLKKGTSLDGKSLFLLPPNRSPVDIRAFVGNVLASIQPFCVEYYRELSKHARRKRNRGSVPPPTAPPTSGTSKTLSSQGWNIRYETKLGCFAEFRQEMDAAGRNYESAYELLFDGDVFESISDWSPRFNETRLLADMLAMRIIRCLLWTGQTTTAAQRWTDHRDRIQDIVDRKGKGSGGYGWMAWEARWSSIMAEMMERMELPVFNVPRQLGPTGEPIIIASNLYAPVEKSVPPEERVPPWCSLHHGGYWLNRSAKCTRARRKLAHSIPDEDRAAPGQSPASVVASQAHLYDTYLCPPPYKEYAFAEHHRVDHAALLVDTLRKSATQFSRRYQKRAVERIALEVAKECMGAGKWAEAMDQLKPLWHNLSWRLAGWWDLVEEVTWTMRECAREMQAWEILVAVEWELMSSSLRVRSDHAYDFAKCLDGLTITNKPRATFAFADTAPTLNATFTFGTSNAQVGERLRCQLTMTCNTHASAAPITASEIAIEFEGVLRDLAIRHDQDQTPLVSFKANAFFSVPVQHRLSSESTTLDTSKATSNLSFMPGQTKIFAFDLYPREVGDAKASRAKITIRTDSFDMEVAIPVDQGSSAGSWWKPSDKHLIKRPLKGDSPWAIQVDPKPPKVEVDFPVKHKLYYTSEPITLPFVVTNGEADQVELTLAIKFTSSIEQVPKLRWPTSDHEVSTDDPNPPRSLPSVTLLGTSKHRIEPTESHEETLTIEALPDKADYTIEVTAHYRLASDPDTPIAKTATKDMLCITPLEATVEASPRVHPDPWPNYFGVPDSDSDPEDDHVGPAGPKGLIQQWSLATRLSSVAIAPLRIHSISLALDQVTQSAHFSLLPPSSPFSSSPTTDDRSSSQRPTSHPDALQTLPPNASLTHTSSFTVQKLSLDDRRPSTLHAHLLIRWSREPSDDATTLVPLIDLSNDNPITIIETALPVSPLAIPFSEPRVIATVHPSSSSSLPNHPSTPPPPPPPLPTPIPLAYTLENPSTHYLTFALTMDSSEAFAFSGPKSVVVRLLPLSRHTVRYRIVPLGVGGVEGKGEGVGKGKGEGVRKGSEGGNKEGRGMDGGRMVWPRLKVRDVGFEKDLRVLAGEGCVWVGGKGLGVRVSGMVGLKER